MIIDEQDLRQLGQYRIDRMNVQGPEARGKTALRLRRDGLIAKEEDLMLDEEIADPVNR